MLKWEKITNTKNRIVFTEAENELEEVDLIRRIPHNGKNYFIPVTIDYHSKWLETLVKSDKEGKTIAEGFDSIVIKNMEHQKELSQTVVLNFKTGR